MASERTLAKRARWRGVRNEWAGSGLSKAAFCREQGVPVWQFYYWQRRLQELAAAAASEAPGFAEVSASADRDSGVRLRLHEGLVVELEPGFDAGTLRAVLALVESPC